MACSLIVFAFTNSGVGQETKKEKEKYVWKTVSGKVVDATGQPVKDAYVCHDNLNHNPKNHTLTDEKGDFELKYRESKAALEKGWLWAYSPDHNLHCVSNTRTDDHLFELPKFTEFKITFLQPDGTPLRGANVRPFRQNIPNGRYSDAKSAPRLGGIIPDAISRKLATTTDENGECVVRNIPRELWGRMVIESKDHGKHLLGGGLKTGSYKLAKTGALKIEILPDEPVEFNETKVWVRGWGTAGETQLKGKIGGLGICEFKHVIPGEIQISLEIGKDEVYQPKLKKQYVIEEGLETHVEIPIKKTVVVRGKVLAGEKPVPNALLKAGELSRLIRTDKNGTYETRAFPGDLSIRVYDMPREFYHDFETGSTHHFPVKDGDLPITFDPIELPPLTEVLIEVVDENNKPVSGFIVTSLYEGRGFGPFVSSKLEKGNAISKIADRDLSNLDEATFSLIRPSKKEDRKDRNEKPKRIELTADPDNIAAVRGGEPLILRCKRADIEKAEQPNQSKESDSNAAPNSKFDLSHWKLTLPVNAENEFRGKAKEISVKELNEGYSNQDFFYMGKNGEMIFWCPVKGAKTTNAKYSRSELREMLDPEDNKKNWSLDGTHSMSATCSVMQVPSEQKIIIGQIHTFTGRAKPLVKLQYNGGKIETLIKVSPEKNEDRKWKFGKVGLNEKIDYQIKVQNRELSVTVNGETRTTNVVKSNEGWAKQRFYFKAGAYVQDNKGPESEGGRVAFSKIDVSHGT